MRRIRRLLDEGKPELARTLLKDAPPEIRDDPTLRDIWVEVHQVAGDTRGAHQLAARWAAGPGAGPADWARAVATATRAGQTAEAAAAATRLLEAGTLLELGASLACLEAINRAGKKVPAAVAAPLARRLAEAGGDRARLTTLEEALGRWSRAGWADWVGQVLDALIERWPDSETTLLACAAWNLEAGNLEAAGAPVARILERRPEHLLARTLSRRIAMLLAALKVLEIDHLLEGRAPSGGVFVLEWEGAKLTCRPTRRFGELEVLHDPPRDELVLAQAELLLGLDRPEDAIVRLQRHDWQDAKNQEHLVSLKARIWRKMGHPDLALEELRGHRPEALALEEDAEGLETWADCLMSAGRMQEAIDLLENLPDSLRWPSRDGMLETARRALRTLVEPVEYGPDADGMEIWIDQRYQVKDRLGQGGMAVVYRVWNRDLAREEALKIVDESKRGTHAVIQAFLNEGEALTRLKHPCVVKVHAVGVHDGRPYISMELLAGSTLADELAREGRLSVSRTVSLLRAIGAGLRFAHDNGIVHRDVKPGNVMLLAGTSRVEGGIEIPDVRLMDFGLASGLETAAASEPAELAGTLHYVSPERINSGRIDHRSDLYSLGVVAYEMLLGRPPFDSPHPHNLLYLHLTRPPAPIRPERPDVPEALEALVLDCLAKDPEKRPRDMSVVLDRLAALDTRRKVTGA